ncbi:hypothetical protein COI93_11240 [Bacillus cereus]|uniref:Uncharacterized protein n=1 Tax=Bacillus cereus TaxID=1396 RepID=A0A2B0ME33_BACCE|nr:hypothetical protein COI93_11240 [Bacillus cereus]
MNCNHFLLGDTFEQKFYPALTGSKTPLQNLERNKEGGESTDRKSPIGSTNNQWGMKKIPTD